MTGVIRGKKAIIDAAGMLNIFIPCTEIIKWQNGMKTNSLWRSERVINILKTKETIEMRCVGGCQTTKGFIDASAAKAARILPEDIERDQIQGK